MLLPESKILKPQVFSFSMHVKILLNYFVHKVELGIHFISTTWND